MDEFITLLVAGRRPKGGEFQLHWNAATLEYALYLDGRLVTKPWAFAARLECPGHPHLNTAENGNGRH